MASEKAKQLAADQKAAAKAAKLAKKNSSDPRDWGWFRQIIQTYKVTAEVFPELRWQMPALIAGITVLTTLLGLWLQPWWLWLITGLMAGIVAALYYLLDRAKRGSYKRYEGQPGSAEVALGMLNNKKWVYTAAITATRQLDVVHRAVGPAGIVLVGEGAPSRAKSLLMAEAKKHEQVAYGVPVITVVMGRGEGEVPLDQLAKYISKLPKKVETIQITEVRQRLRALDAVRPKAPMPRGPAPSIKGVGRALRGR